MTAPKSQCDIIEDILERDGRIDNFSAIHQRISLRLGARIWDPKQRGWKFRVEIGDDKNTAYHVIGKPGAKQLPLAMGA